MKIKILGYQIIISKTPRHTYGQDKPKTWTRKGRCPDCNVSGGSKHNNACQYDYLPTKKNKYLQ